MTKTDTQLSNDIRTVDINKKNLQREKTLTTYELRPTQPMQKCNSPVFNKEERYSMMQILIRFFSFEFDVIFDRFWDLLFLNSKKKDV